MILVTGGRGMLGKYVTDGLTQHQLSFVSPLRQQLNLSSLASVQQYLSQQNFSAIVHLGAETDVDLCERDLNHAYTTNTLATEMLARYAGERQIPFIFISTSAVFGGLSRLSYCELDQPMPINYYGASKWMAEQAVRAMCQSHLIIRSSFMVGGGPLRDKKFISKILPKLKQHEPVAVVHDKIGSLTYAKDVAEFIVEICQSPLTGLVHYSSDNSCSRYDVVSYLAKQLNSDSLLTKVSAPVFPLSAPRAISEALYSISPIKIPKKSWEMIIDDYLKEWVECVA